MARARKLHPQLPSVVTSRPLDGTLAVTLFSSETAPRRRSEGADGRPDRPVPELHGGARVAVRRPGTVRRWLGRSVAGFEPRRLSMPLIRHNLHSPRAAETSQISLVKYFLRRIAGVFRLG